MDRENRDHMDNRPSKIAVIGGGSWGTALAIHCARLEIPVSLWVFEEDLAERMTSTRENDVFLPGAELPPGITPTVSLEECLAGAQMVLSVVPSHVIRDVWDKARLFLPVDAILVNATKGIEEDTYLTATGVLVDILGPDVLKMKVTLSGPTFAREVSLGLPAAAVIAGMDSRHNTLVQEVLAAENFRLYTNTDPIGVEIAGALKNVMAISVGMCDGLELGLNARAALITRGLAEITRLGIAMGAEPLTFQGLAGVGDLVLTCTGDLSRNRTLGLRLGRGETLDEITGSSPMVAEGVRTARSAHGLAVRAGGEMPITEEVFRVLYEGKDTRSALKSLLRRSLKEEGA